MIASQITARLIFSYDQLYRSSMVVEGRWRQSIVRWNLLTTRKRRPCVLPETVTS